MGNKKYKNIVFDVGDVLFSYRWIELFTENGCPEDRANEIFKRLFTDDLWVELDKETMSYEAVTDGFCEKFPEDAKYIRYFFEHYEEMPLPRYEVWEGVRKLKEKGYMIYILSNYCSVLFNAHTKNAPFMQYVDGMVVSYMIHTCKPDPLIFETLFERYGLDPEESLFFDDRIGNVEGSKKVGMDAILVESEDFLVKELSKLL